MTKKRNKQLGRILSVILSVAMLVTGLPAEMLGVREMSKVEAAGTKYEMYATAKNTITNTSDFFVDAYNHSTKISGSDYWVKDADIAKKSSDVETTGAVKFSSGGIKADASGLTSVKRAVEFTTTEPSTMVIYAENKTGETNLGLYVYKDSGAGLKWSREKIIGTIDNAQFKKFTVTLSDAGTYAVSSESNATYIQYLSVSYAASTTATIAKDVTDVAAEKQTAADALKVKFKAGTVTEGVFTPGTAAAISTADGEDELGLTQGTAYQVQLYDGANESEDYRVKSVTATPAASATVTGSAGNIVVTAGEADTTALTVVVEEIPSYTVTYNLKGHGDAIAPVSVKAGRTVTAPDEPSATGYTFEGWYADEGLTEKFAFADAEEPAKITEATTIYAKWTVKTYGVTFDVNGGTNDGGDIIGTTVKVNYGETVTEPADPVKTPGYNFDGWHVKSEDETLEADNYNFASEVTGDLTLVAKWKGKTFTVNYTPTEAGTVTESTWTADKGTSVTFPDKIAEPTKPAESGNYTFLYWKDKTGVKFDFATVIDETSPLLEDDKTTLKLYAHWEDKSNTMTVTYKSGENNATEVIKSVSDGVAFDGTDVTATPISKKEFKYWYDENDDTQANYFATERTAAKGTSVTLVAKYANLYDVVFYDEDGTTELKASQKVEDGRYAVLPGDPEKEGYRFVGWEVVGGTATYTSVEMVTHPITADTNFKAKYQQVANVVYNLNGGKGGEDFVGTIVSVDIGTTPAAPGTVTRDGYTFDGWFTDAENGTEFSFAEGSASTITAKMIGDENTITLYAHWTPNTYTVKFDANGGSGSMADQTGFTYGTATKLKANEFTYDDDHVFMGWCLNSVVTGADKVYKNEEAVSNLTTSDSVTLHAVWKTVVELNETKVSADEIAQFGDSDEFQIIDGTTYFVDGDYSTNGFTFVSSNKGDPATKFQWILKELETPVSVDVNGESKTFYYAANTQGYVQYKVDNGTVKNNGRYFYFTAPTDKDSTLTVVFQKAGTDELAKGFILSDEVKNMDKADLPATYTTDKANGEAEVVTIPLEKGKKYYVLPAKYPTITPEGATKAVTGGNINILYLAITTAPTYTVTFNSNEGSAVDPITDVEAGAKITKPADPTKTGYAFKGWFTSAELDGEFNFANDTVNGNIELFAKWEAEKYTVSFNSNGGSAVAAIENVVYNTTITKPENPTKTGFIFNSWCKDEALTTAFNFETDKITATTTLYAKWDEDPAVEKVTIIFETNGGSAVDEAKVAKGATLTKPADPTREGYTFGGWYKEAALENEYVFTDTVTEGFTLYAKWDIKQVAGKYIVTFEANGGSAVAAISVTAGEKAAKPADPVKTGYTFKGWFSDKDLKTEYTFDTAINANITLYAKWEEVKTTPGTQGGKDTPGTQGGEETGELQAAFQTDAVVEGVDYVWYNSDMDRYEITYTGAKLMPAIVVTNGTKVLTESVDYTVKYANNVKVTGKEATVVVTGKGNYSGKLSLRFYIVPVDIAAEYNNTVFVGNTKVAVGSKAAPVVVYNGMKLTGKDYYLSRTEKLTAEGETQIDIIAKGGNYTGIIEGVTFDVVPKSALRKIKADLSKDANKTHIYNGAPQELTIASPEDSGELAVYAADTKESLTKDTDYFISYSANVNAGKVKVLITGTGDFAGSVTKTFKILPDKTSKMTLSFGTGDGHDTTDGKDTFSFRKTGVTPEIVVTLDERSEELKQGVDYKVSYSANKAVGTGYYTVTFLGNYKGHAAFKKMPFTIVKANLSEADVVVYPMAYNPKKKTFGKYMQAPFVMLGSDLLNKKEYTVTYKLDDENGTVLTKKTPVTLSAENPEMTVYVEVVPNAKKSNYESDGAVASGTYTIFFDSRKDISKAKIWLRNPSNNKKVSKVYYTGVPVTFDGDDEDQAELVVTLDRHDYAGDELKANFDVVYVNNIQKGKATVIITATDANETYCGSKTGKFTIAASNIKEKMKALDTEKAIKDILKKLFQKE